MKHAEIVIARQAVEEGRGLVVIVNKVDLLKAKQKPKLYEDVVKAVPEEIQKLIPQVCLLKLQFHCSSKSDVWLILLDELAMFLSKCRYANEGTYGSPNFSSTKI